MDHIFERYQNETKKNYARLVLWKVVTAVTVDCIIVETAAMSHSAGVSQQIHLTSPSL